MTEIWHSPASSAVDVIVEPHTVLTMIAKNIPHYFPPEDEVLTLNMPYRGAPEQGDFF